MSKASMEILISELAAELGLPDLALDEQDYVCVQTEDGVVFNMDYFDDADVLSTYTTIGEVPEDRRLPVFQAMLEANFAWDGTGGATLCLDPEGKLALLTVDMPVAELNLSRLQARMRDFSELAWMWSERIRELVGESSPRDGTESAETSVSP